jgi:hypothetical protein
MGCSDVGDLSGVNVDLIGLAINLSDFVLGDRDFLFAAARDCKFFRLRLLGEQDRYSHHLPHLKGKPFSDKRERAK